jgi:TRAP-type C4-dicarboxylate transport system permease small subunit
MAVVHTNARNVEGNEVRKIAECIQKLNYFFYFLCKLNVFLVTLIVFISVVSRYCFNNPLEWSEEITAYMFVFVVFLGAADVASRNGHIRLDFLADRLEGGKRKFLDIMMHGIALFWSSLICWSSWKAVMMAYDLDFASSSLLRFPLFIPYSFLAAGILLLSLQFIIMLIQDFNVTPLSKNK